MKILLVNSNPVVSRLTALSARKENVEIDEIKNISELKKSDYNVIFVDSDSYTAELSSVLQNSDINKRVLFYAQDDEERPELFNFTILKPFLPSEVSAILRKSKIELDRNRDKQTTEHLNLDELIADKKDDLEPINLLKDDTIETKEPIEVQDSSDLQVEKSSPTKSENDKPEIKELEEDKIETQQLVEDIKPEILEQDKKEPIDKIELFELDSDDKKENVNDNSELFSIDSVGSKDNLLDFDIENRDEIDLDSIYSEVAESDNSTKILDKDEISNIKNLLNEEIEMDDSISLDDIMATNTPTATTATSSKTKEKKKKKRKVKKSKTNEKISSELLTETLGAMPIDDLRRLLRGTKINITIKFPKK